MPIVSTDKCIFSNRNFFSQFVSDTNYCAGFRNGKYFIMYSSNFISMLHLQAHQFAMVILVEAWFFQNQEQVMQMQFGK